MEKKKNIYFTNFKNKYIKHPFFSFFNLSLALIIILFISNLGIPGFEYVSLTSYYNSLIWYISVLGFAILLGFSGLASLGTASFVGISAYLTATMMEKNIPFIVVLGILIILGVVLGVIVGFISLRVEGLFLAIVTLGVAEVIIKIIESIWGTAAVTKIGQLKILGQYMDLNDWRVAIIVIFVMLIIMMLTYNIMNSPTGRAMLSMKNSQSAASAMGINILKYKITAFSISSVFAMITGSLFMLFNQNTEPNQWGLNISLLLLAAVVIGGSRSIFGILIGTLFMFSFQSLLQLSPVLKQVSWLPTFISGLLLILVVTFYPQGIVGLKYDIKKLYYKIKKKIKERKVIKDE